MTILWTPAGSRVSRDTIRAPGHQQAAPLLLQWGIDHADPSESAEVHSGGSLWNSCLNITAPKVNPGQLLPCKGWSIATPALLLTALLTQPVKETACAFTPRNKLVIPIREDRRDVAFGMSSSSLSACEVCYNDNNLLMGLTAIQPSSTSTNQGFHWWAQQRLMKSIANSGSF